MESTGDTYLFEHAIGFKKIPWVFFEKVHFEKFKLLYQKYLDLENEKTFGLQDVNFSSRQILFSAPILFFISLSSYGALKK